MSSARCSLRSLFARRTQSCSSALAVVAPPPGTLRRHELFFCLSVQYYWLSTGNPMFPGLRVRDFPRSEARESPCAAPDLVGNKRPGFFRPIRAGGESPGCKSPKRSPGAKCLKNPRALKEAPCLPFGAPKNPRPSLSSSPAGFPTYFCAEKKPWLLTLGYEKKRSPLR